MPSAEPPVPAPRVRLPRPRLRRPTRRRALACVGGVVLLALVVVAVGLKPAATALVRSRLADRVGPVVSLRIDGSPLDLLRRSPDAVAVHFEEATIGGGEDVGGGDALRRVPRLDLRADALDTGQFRFEDVAATVQRGTLRATAAMGPQAFSVRGQELPVTPRAVDGRLQLEIALGPIALPLAVDVRDGRPRVVVAGDGPLAGRELPMGAAAGDGRGGGLRISRLGATERDGRVVVTIDGATEA